MSSSMDLTKDWLRNVLRPYPARDRILSEVMDILMQRRTLLVKTDAFTFDNGQAALLVLLHGTLPITFRGAKYHIPIHIWIPHEYPSMAPLAFVVPTKEMGVRKGREVEPSGRVAESVVQVWWNGWQDKSIEKLLCQLTSIFSATPPVFAKPTAPTQTNSNGQASTSQPGPAYSTSPVPMRNPDQPPPPPARPFSGGGFSGPPPIATESLPRYQSEQTPPPHPFPHQQVLQPHNGNGPLRQVSSPPVPHRPSTVPSHLNQGPPGGPMLPQRPYIPQSAHGPPMSPTAGPSYSGPRYSRSPPPQSGYQSGPGPQPIQGYQPPSGPQYQMPVNGQHPQHQQQQYPHPHQRQSSGQFQPPHPSQSPAPAPQPNQVPQNLPRAQPPIQQTRQPMQDLLSSPEQPTSALPSQSQAQTGAPPPLPPSKPPPPSLLHLHSILLPHLQASLLPLQHSLEANCQQLRERHEDVVSGEPAIRDEMARLEAVKKVCDSVGRKLGDAVAQGQERVAELEARGEVSVDEVVCGISIVHNQLIDLVAEDNAIEDTIYHMTRALDNERIDLDRYMKAIRSLAREQYMKRALIERILQGMGQTQGW